MSKTRLEPLPKSKAKTAYELLSDVCQIILDEPKRYDQGNWIARIGGVGNAYHIDRNDAPACGTVGCVAGWVATLKRGRRFAYNEAEPIARAVLGIDHAQGYDLFSGDALCHVDYNPQTKRYAKAGVAHIRRFQKKYAKQLKAKAV